MTQFIILNQLCYELNNVLTNQNFNQQKIIMKKTLFLSVLLLTLQSAYSQSIEGFKKGNCFIIGSLNLQNIDSGSLNQKLVEFSPSFGFFEGENIVLGARISVGQEKSKLDSILLKNNTTFSIGAFARYYFTPKSRFSIFGHLGANLNSKTEKLTKSGESGFDIGVSPGFNYFISNHFAVEAIFGRMGFESIKSDTEGSKNKNILNFDLNLRSIGFGLIYKF